MIIRLRELISACCQSMATSRTICFEPIHVFLNNYDKFVQRKLLLSSDVELNPGASDIDPCLVPHRLK